MGKEALQGRDNWQEKSGTQAAQAEKTFMMYLGNTLRELNIDFSSNQNTLKIFMRK